MLRFLCVLSLAAGLFLQATITYAEDPLSVEEVYSIICQPQYKWHCPTMVQVAYRESNWIPSATNYTCSDRINPSTGKLYICAGLLQIIESWWPQWTDLWNPYFNVEVAYQVWLKQGYQAWGLKSALQE